MSSAVKIVEIARSKYGYGFTLSGEMPCRLTQVKGHASTAGLKSGDRLNAVNGQNVELLGHDEVVELITSSDSSRLILHVTSVPHSIEDFSNDDGEDDMEILNQNISLNDDSMPKQHGICYELSSNYSDSDGDTSSSTASSTYGVVSGSSNRHQLRSHHSHQHQNRAHSRANHHQSTGQQHRNSKYHLNSHLNSQNNGTQKRSHRHNSNHHQNILRPSQTYEPKPSSRQSKSSSAKHSNHYQNSASVSHRQQQRQNRDLKCKSNPLLSNVNIDNSLNNLSNEKYHQSTETINCVSNVGDDELLQLHQHYRNRFKCSKSNHNQIVDDSGNKSNTASSSNCEIADAKIYNKENSQNSDNYKIRNVPKVTKPLSSNYSDNLSEKVPTVYQSQYRTNSMLLNQVSVEVDIHHYPNSADDYNFYYNHSATNQATAESQVTNSVADNNSLLPSKELRFKLPTTTIDSGNHNITRLNRKLQAVADAKQQLHSGASNYRNINSNTNANGHYPSQSIRSKHSTTSGVSSTSPSSSSNSTSPASTTSRQPAALPSGPPVSASNHQTIDQCSKSSYRFTYGSSFDNNDHNNKNNNNSDLQSESTQLQQFQNSELTKTNFAVKRRNHSHNPKSSTKSTNFGNLSLFSQNDANPEAAAAEGDEDEDCHSGAIFRSIVLCLSISKHHFDCGTRRAPPDMKTISEIIPQQLVAASSSSSGSNNSSLESMIPVLIAAYTDEIYLVTAPSSFSSSVEIPTGNNKQFNFVVKSNQILQCGLLPSDNSYFALLVKDNGQQDCNEQLCPKWWCRCFVFMINRTYAESHWNHLKVAQRFGLNCTADPINANCLEFSENAEQILRVICTLYRKQLSLMSSENLTKSVDLLCQLATDTISTHGNQRNQQSIKADNVFQNSLSCRVVQSVSDPDQPDLIKHDQYLIDDTDDLPKKLSSDSINTNLRFPKPNLVPINGSLSRPRVVIAPVPSTVPIRPKRSSRRAQTLAPMQPPPPPPPLPAAASHKLNSNGLPAVVVDPNEDSSPSCCATTSCDSFSFQQFQQHIQHQQHQNQPNNLPSSQSRTSNMRTNLVDSTSCCLSGTTTAAAGSIGIIQIDGTKQTAANQTHIASHTAPAAVQPKASDDYPTNITTNTTTTNNNNNNRRTHAAATDSLSQQSTEVGSENFLLQQAKQSPQQPKQYYCYSKDSSKLNNVNRSVLSYSTTAALLPAAPSRQLFRASTNQTRDPVDGNVYLRQPNHQPWSFNQQSQQFHSIQQSQLSPSRVISQQHSAATVSNLPATPNQFSSSPSSPGRHLQHHQSPLVSADQQSISTHQLTYSNHPRPGPIKASQSCYQLFSESNAVANQHHQPHHFNLQSTDHLVNAGSLLNCASVGVDCVPFSLRSSTAANDANRFGQYPHHQSSYRHPKPKRFHTLYHNADHQSTPLGLDQLSFGNTAEQRRHHLQQPLPGIFCPLVHSISNTPSSILFSSHNDLSFNSHQLEAQFSPSNVRQATQRYLQSYFAANSATSLSQAPVNGQHQSLTTDLNNQTNRFSNNRHHNQPQSYQRMDPNQIPTTTKTSTTSVNAFEGLSRKSTCDISTQQPNLDKGDNKLVRCSESKSSLVDNGNASAFTATGGTSLLDSDLLFAANQRPRSSTDTDIDGSQDAHPPTTTEETSDETDGTSSQTTANNDRDQRQQQRNQQQFLQMNSPPFNKTGGENPDIVATSACSVTARSYESSDIIGNDHPETIKEVNENVAEDDAHSKMLMYPCITDEYCWMESPPEFPISERPVDVGWVGGWASDFDILLSDPVGVRAFTDFLRKEFSYENLEFFLTLQEYKKLTLPDEIKLKTCEIFDNFISQSASDPVNVDSKARKAAEIAMKEDPMTTRTFQLAEKQVYNLMKFDSYQRFLKSEIYKECALLELQGKPLPYEIGNEDTANNCDNNNNNNNNSSEFGGPSCTAGNGTNTAPKQIVKSKRKSLIPWSRIKSSITNNKAASLSSMPSGHKETSSFKRPMMMRKITNSITKIRSKSLDEHITNHINKHAVDSGGHSASVDKPVVNQKSLNLGDSRNSLLANNSDSIDLSDTSTNNVFSPSPDNKEQSRLAAFANESATQTVSSPRHNSPIKQNSVPIPNSNTASSFSHNCNRDNCHFLRIIFPDRSQTVVPSTPNETIDSLLRRLIEKRSLKYLAYDVFVDESDKPLDLNTNSILLGCTELRVEQRVLFQLEFPNQDIVGVKARPSKLCSEVFRPLLLRYGYRPEHITLSIADLDTALVGTMPISVVDGQRIIVSYRDDLEEWGWDTTKSNIPVALNSSLNKSNLSDSNNGDNQAALSQSQQPDSPSSGSHSELPTKTDAYQNVDQISDKLNQNSKINSIVYETNCNNNRNTSSIVAIETDAAIPGDDTQSDSFFREILTSAQYVPSPMQEQILPSPSSKLHSQTTPVKSTSSVAYGIVQSNLQSPISQSYHHLNTQLQPASNAGSSSFHPPPIRRFHSINEQYISRSIKSQINEPNIEYQQKPSDATALPSRTTYKANHLRELQNHRNFKSQVESTSTTDHHSSLDHSSNGQNAATRHSFISAHQYPLDLNTTADEMNLLMLHKVSPVSTSSPSINTLSSMSTSVPPPPMPISNTGNSSQFAPLLESPETSPIKAHQSNPPPLPPKSGQICTQMIQSNNSSQSIVPPPRPPPISPNKAKLTSSLSQQSQQQPAPPPYYYNHNRGNNNNNFNLQQTKAATVDLSMPSFTTANAVVELNPDSYV